MTEKTYKVGNRTIEASNVDKVLFPDSGHTKGDLIDYYARIAEIALPHYKNRPLSMHRFPDGIGEDGFFQKDMPDYFPDWIDHARLKKEGGTIDYVVANNAATLVYLANQACIEPHLGLSTTDKIDAPDRMIFDLDPSDGDFSKVQKAGRALKDLFDDLSVKSFVQTTGSRGLHVIVPLRPSTAFDDVRALARKIAEIIEDDDPDTFTTRQRKEKRGKRVFIDYLRNAYGQTSVAPYAVRARKGAPVATPMDWDEALSGEMTPTKYTLDNIFQRLSRKEDPWKSMAPHAVDAGTLKDKIDGKGG